MHTSGGRTTAASPRVRAQEPGNLLTWSDLHRISGRGVIADTGYGVGGKLTSDPELDSAWLDAEHVRARMGDGVIAVTHANPALGWEGKVNRLRATLPPARHCMHVRPSPNSTLRISARKSRGLPGAKEHRVTPEHGTVQSAASWSAATATRRRPGSAAPRQDDH